MVGPLDSTRVTPLQSYYEPLRLPKRAIIYVMHSIDVLGSTHSVGPLRFRSVLSTRAVSNHPGGSNEWLSNSSSSIGVRLQIDWHPGHPQLSVTRPNRVHLHYGSCLCSAELRPKSYLFDPPLHYVPNEQLTRWALVIPLEQISLS